MLAQRILTALVAIPLIIYLMHAGGYFFATFVLFLQCVALYEFNNMTVKKGAGMHLFSGLVFPVLFTLIAFYTSDLSLMFLLTVLATVLIMLQGIFAHTQQNWLEKNLYSFLSLCYIGLLFPIFILLRQTPGLEVASYFGQMDFGTALLWLCLLGTWSSDTFAYFVGTAFGKHKLCPAISPNKSWEGALAGFVGCIVAVWLFGTYVFPLTQVNLPVLGILIGFFAPMGDLAESQLKRFFGVKDSGNIFPGHGGVLDRLDSLLFVIPVIYVYLNFTLG